MAIDEVSSAKARTVCISFNNPYDQWKNKWRIGINVMKVPYDYMSIFLPSR